MKNFFFLFVIILASFSESTQAKSLELKFDTSIIFLQARPGWSLGKELFGIPFVYFSPQVNGQRSNISFTDTGAEIELDVQTIAASQNKYQETRKAWAQKVNAIALGFIPYQVKVNQHGHKVHSIGFLYQHEGKAYKEKSYYIQCRGKILFSKSLRLQENEVHEQNFDDLISGLDCAGV
jgi:hypothetical protein